MRSKGTVLDVSWLLRKGTHLVSGVSIGSKAVQLEDCPFSPLPVKEEDRPLLTLSHAGLRGTVPARDSTALALDALARRPRHRSAIASDPVLQKRSRVITLLHAEAKSRTNFSLASAAA